MSLAASKPASGKKLLATLSGLVQEIPPVWLMRQAGRYLPEYRALRQRAKNFVEFCLTPELAIEATLQPIRRFGFDAAILFSDILIVPHALGQEVSFREGEGPVLAPVRRQEDLAGLSQARVLERTAPVMETVKGVRRALPPEVTLIGFAGAPWTVATYMVEGGASKDYANAKLWSYREPAGFQRLIDLVIEATIAYLDQQIRAGAEVIQLFDSWAGVLAEPDFQRWVIEPNSTIVRRLKQLHPGVPIIAFPRGAGILYERFAAAVGADALGLDTTVPLDWARAQLQPRWALQGNLEPLVLCAGGAVLEQEVQRIRAALAGGPFIFNLGHGILPATPPEHVAQLLEFLARLMGAAAERTAIVLFNLGGPDRPAAVAPFLVNLFSDPAIIGLPQPFRFLLARLIARRRAPVARAIYDQIGGGSPLLANTEAQASALEAALAGEPGANRCFIAMRYWHPLADAAAAAIKEWGATRILLLPLYPQFSSTSTASSLADWRRAAGAAGLNAPTQAICCYPAAAGWIAALADGIRAALPQARAAGAPPRLLFSAHGLPQRVVERGDPYQWQVERSAAAVAERLAACGEPVEWLVCYQSRVGPLQWLTPSTDAEIARAGAEKRPLIVCPIAFVSEHSETLVELDIEYRHLAERAGVPAYIRVPTVGTAPGFVAALAELVRAALASGAPLRAGRGAADLSRLLDPVPQDGGA